MRLEPIANPALQRTMGLPAVALISNRDHYVPAGHDGGCNAVFGALGLIFKGAFGSQFAALETLNRATPLIFTGLAVAVAFRAKLWNIGAEAQLYVGAVVTVVLGTGALPWASSALIPTIALAAMVAGAMVLLLPTFLKTRFGVDEVVTTLLLNFVVLLWVSMLLEGRAERPDGRWAGPNHKNCWPRRDCPASSKGCACTGDLAWR